jgi:hypothetical protein
MKRVLMIAIAGVAAAMLGAAACDDSPTDPSGGTITPTTFTIPMSPANEVPAITNAESVATGSATIVLRITRDSNGTPTAATADFQFNVANFPGGSTITMAHIHPGAAGSTGSILVDTGLSAGQLALSGGAGSISRNGINVTADTAVAIVNNAAGYYFNVHSAMNPDGVLRGQLQGGGATVDPGSPEPVPYE